jgi:hypothetical protein
MRRTAGDEPFERGEMQDGENKGDKAEKTDDP